MLSQPLISRCNRDERSLPILGVAAVTRNYKTIVIPNYSGCYHLCCDHATTYDLCNPGSDGAAMYCLCLVLVSLQAPLSTNHHQLSSPPPPPKTHDLYASSNTCFHTPRAPPSPLLQNPAARRAWWSWLERIYQSEKRTKRTYTQFTVACLLLGLLLLHMGGPDDVQLQLETLDQDLYSRLIFQMWLFWESYFAGIAAVVALGKLVGRWVRWWRYRQMSGGAGVISEAVEEAIEVIKRGDRE